ncbi:MAG TPA: YbaB/EbfC family nucleoid-associated protein [Candidatus Paceibacterota bacterium]|nr:YbaB/EbfC family nucleoid-associated protein [Candidatus Paceibacterota bacterium]HRY76568.1 YbaB/EbfC family nucleoid-associated protein [Candidatus Paceibacterota bacterium]
MFDKIKQLAQMKSLQDSIKQEKVEVIKEGVRIVLRGDFSIEEINLNPDLAIEKQQEILKECLNDGMKKVQMLAAQKLSGLMG